MKPQTALDERAIALRDTMKVATDNVRQILLLLGALLLLSIPTQAQFAHLVKDINAQGTGSDPSQFVDVGGVVFFSALDLATGIEL